MLNLVSVLTSEAFWIAVGSFGAIFTLALMYQQIKRTDFVASTEFLLKLDDNFYSDKMLKKRRKIMEIFKKDKGDFEKMNECRDVFDFFEILGLLVRMKAIPKELVWSDFCYWIQRYWTAFKGYVEWARKEDNDITEYGEFRYLFKEIHAYDERKRNPSFLPLFLRRGKHIEITQKELEEFADEEIKLGEEVTARA